MKKIKTSKSSKREANVNVKDTDVEKMMNAIMDRMFHHDKCGICSLMGEAYDNYGNNAYPFEGRCCDEANLLYVIPARIMGITPDDIKTYGKARVMKAIEYYHNEGKFDFLYPNL